MQNLEPIGGLFTNSWKRFTERFATAVAIFAVPAILITLSRLLFVQATPPAFVLGAIIYVIAVIVSIIGSFALISALGNKTNFAESYSVGTKLFWPGVWVAILVGVATLGGLIMLIIPGIILMVQLALTNYTIVLDDKRGMAALAQSRAYIKGHWWAFVGRMLLLVLIVIVISLVIITPLSLLLGKVFGVILSGIFLLCVTPFAVSYEYEIFHNLRRLKPHVATEAAKDDSSFIKVSMIVGIIGAILIPIFIIAAIAILGPNLSTRFHRRYPNGGTPITGFNPGGPMLPVAPTAPAQSGSLQ